ncbi:pentatricopeptide repeat-containing protein At2g13600 isoform X2 [Daucus carota subsp. sativus]|uniref:pentatricopeptide repeat-containing protein At2g13600 isoform X2 n=1 Tax=Daucus carota subsp. sativus TaxID=79200 RepID=UPI003082D144
MRSKKLVNLTRAISTIACKNNPTTIPLTSLQLDTYIQPSDRDTIYSYNKAIDYQVKYGSLSYAHQLFDEMIVRDVVTWNAMISGYNKCGFFEEAVWLYRQMVVEGVCESSSTFSTVLSVCCNAGWCRRGLEVFSRAVVLGFGLNVFVVSAVISVYMGMNFFDVGFRLFSGLSERKLAVWNLVLRGCCDSGRSRELFGVFRSMGEEGVRGNALTFCYMIRGCGNDELVEEGKQVHCHVVKNGWCEVNIFVKNALVDFYSACGCLLDAEKSFVVISPKDLISWNSMVSAYGNGGLIFEALEIFSKMQYWGKKPSVRSFVGLLTLCREEKNIVLGNQIHCFVKKTGFDVGSAYVQSALIDMYGKCGEIETSVSIFQGDHEISLESCNSMMTSLLQYDMFDDVVELFAMMLAKGIRFDEGL